MVKVSVRSARKLGLEVWQVFVNGSLQAEFLSEEAANAKAMRLNKSLHGDLIHEGRGNFEPSSE